ncbi:MAG TPA: type II secretion system protein [Oligoflexia bacterium]|nr:type II secretion system protein [Oligoflexia bacterium]HMR25663.1 type II secretion system protein [Oligoflexia bacterium]
MIKKRNALGFTLVELSVVLIIIGFVTTVSMNTYFEQILKSKASEAFVYLRSIHDAQFVFANQIVYTKANLSQCIPESRFSRIASSVCDSATYCGEINARPPARKKQYVYIYSTYNDNLFSTENCGQSIEFAQVGSWEALGLSSVNRNQAAVSQINSYKPSLLAAVNENFGIPSAQAGLLGNLIGGGSDDDDEDGLLGGDADADIDDGLGDLVEHVDNLLGGDNTSEDDGSEIDALLDVALGDNNLGIDVDIDLDGDGDSLIEGSASGESTENENGGQDTLLDIDLSLNMPGNGGDSDPEPDNGPEDNENENEDNGDEAPINNQEIALVGDKINIIRLPTPLNFSFYAAHNEQIMQEYGVDDLAKTITIFAIADVDGDYTGEQISFPEQFENNGVNPILLDNVWVVSRSLYIDEEGDIQVVGGIYQANQGE